MTNKNPDLTQFKNLDENDIFSNPFNGDLFIRLDDEYLGNIRHLDGRRSCASASPDLMVKLHQKNAVQIPEPDDHTCITCCLDSSWVIHKTDDGFFSGFCLSCDSKYHSNPEEKS